MENCFIKLNVDFIAASGWLERLVRRVTLTCNPRVIQLRSSRVLAREILRCSPNSGLCFINSSGSSRRSAVSWSDWLGAASHTVKLSKLHQSGSKRLQLPRREPARQNSNAPSRAIEDHIIECKSTKGIERGHDDSADRPDQQ